MNNGVDRADAKNGASYLKIHHYADPGKDSPEWLQRMHRELGERDYRREILMDDSIYEGEPVFLDYQDHIHNPVYFRTNPVPPIAGSTYFGGWDLGQTMNPAFVLIQQDPWKQLHAMVEVLPGRPMGMSNFAPRVLQTIKKVIPGRWNSVHHFGDETGRTRSGSDERSAFNVAEEHKIVIMPVSNRWHDREQAVVWALTDWVEQEGDDPKQWVPRFIVSQFGCPTLVEALRGAYCMQVNKNHESSGPGMVLSAPAKNAYSHIADALQYPLVRIKDQTTASPARRARR